MLIVKQCQPKLHGTGTPFLRFNDFVGKLSYLKDLEENYKLGYGFMSHEKTKLFKKLDELLNTYNIKSIWDKKKNIMIKRKKLI